MSDHGNLVLCGRTSEMYIRGGFNIHPAPGRARPWPTTRKARWVAIVWYAGRPTIGEIGVVFVEPIDPD